MITRLIFICAIALLLNSCESNEIRESHTITDFSKPVTLVYKCRSSKSGEAGFKIRGNVNGTLGFSEGVYNSKKEKKTIEFNGIENLSKVDSADMKYLRIVSDCVMENGSLSIGQGNLLYTLHFIPGTATEGRIEVEFWERPDGSIMTLLNN